MKKLDERYCVLLNNHLESLDKQDTIGLIATRVIINSDNVNYSELNNLSEEQLIELFDRTNAIRDEIDRQLDIDQMLESSCKCRNDINYRLIENNMKIIK